MLNFIHIKEFSSPKYSSKIINRQIQAGKKYYKIYLTKDLYLEYINNIT